MLERVRIIVVIKCNRAVTSVTRGLMSLTKSMSFAGYRNAEKIRYPCWKWREILEGENNIKLVFIVWRE